MKRRGAFEAAVIAMAMTAASNAPLRFISR